MSQKEKILVMISNTYPYGSGEVFLEKEISAFAKYVDKIIIYPLSNYGTNIRDYHAKTEVRNTLVKRLKKIDRKQFAKNFFFVFKVLLMEFIHTQKKRFFLCNIRELNSIAHQCLQAGNQLAKEFREFKDEEVFYYAVWVEEGALMLAMLKQAGEINQFAFRYHGYDLYDERREGGYMPFRYYNMQMVDKAFVLSKHGEDYLRSKNLNHKNIIHNYNGAYDKGINCMGDHAVFTVVSCSNVIPLKRVDLLAEALKFIKFEIRWVHFGDGEKSEEVKSVIRQLPGNVRAEYRGAVSNAELLKFYQQESINLFIHLSETEGLGVALIEAISFGIPVMGCDTGGVPEIVNDQTGILLPVEITPKEVANKIATFRDSELNSVEFRKGVRNFWRANFDAEKLYDEFAQTMLSG